MSFKPWVRKLDYPRGRVSWIAAIVAAVLVGVLIGCERRGATVMPGGLKPEQRAKTAKPKTASELRILSR